MRKSSVLHVLLIILFASGTSLQAQDASVAEIHAGYDGWFRPGEWTPLELVLQTAAADGAVEIVVNDSLRFAVQSKDPLRFRTWIVLNKPSANKVEIFAGGNLLYSTTRSETLPLSLQSASPEFRLVGIFFGTPLPLAQAAQLLHGNAIHATNLQNWHFGRSDMMQSLDRVVSNNAQLHTLTQAQNNAITDWQKGHGQLDNIDVLGLDRSRFLDYIINAEALREVCHSNFSIDQDIYRVFNWTEPPATSLFILTCVACAFGVFLLLVITLLQPAKSKLLAYAFWTALSVICAITSQTLSARQTMLVQENASVILLNQDATAEQLTWTSCTSHFDGERFPDCATDTAIIPVLYSIGDNPYIQFKHVQDSVAPFSTGFALERNRRPAFFARSTFATRGNFSVSTTESNCLISNYSGARFSRAFLFHYGKIYTLGSLPEGKTQQALGKPQVALEQVEGLADAEKQLLAFWSSHIGNPLHVYFVGIPDYGYGGFTDHTSIAVLRVSE